MARGNNAQAQQQGDAEDYNDEEQRFFEEEEDDDEDDSDVVIGARASRKQGCPSDRLKAAFNQKSLEQVQAHFNIIIADDLTDEERRHCMAIVNEIRDFILSRPKKTNDLYYRHQEQLLAVLPKLYELGIVKAPSVPADAQVRATTAHLMTPDAMVVILQHLMHNKDLSSITSQHSIDAAATAAAAANSSNPYNQDDYAAGAVVDILGDAEDADADGLQLQPLFVVARGRIKGVYEETAAGTKVYEVEGVDVVHPDLFKEQDIYLDARGLDVNENTLAHELQKHQSLLVPVTHLRAIDADRDGPHATGAAASLTKEAVGKMKLAELKLMCSELQLSVRGRAKAPFQAALLAWIGERGADAAVVQPPQAALKMSRFTYKNWMNAATDLQKTQHMLLGSVPQCVLRSYPRVQRWVQTFKRTTTMALRRAVNDRQAGTLPSRPGETQFNTMYRNWLEQKSLEGLLYGALFKEQVANAQRGGETRSLQLADRYTKGYETVKPVTAVAVGSLKMNGKTNQNGQLMYYCHLRHADPLHCPVAADGLFQLMRFGVKGQPFPDFSPGTEENWYHMPVYPSAAGGTMEYEEHRKNQRDALDGIDCQTTKSTHLPRQAGPDLIVARGGSREQAMVHGHWARQDADLSYMNQPAIATMLLVAGFSSLNTHYLSWAHMEPPKYCMDRLFVTPEGVTIDEQVQKLTEVNREKGTRRVTNLNVAKYFREIGKAALQALPILQAQELIPATHPVLQHPAINNQQYREYAVVQAQHSMGLMSQFRLLETPVLGPVFTQSTPMGNMTSALGTQEGRRSIMTGAVVTYAATAAAAYTQARGVDLSAGGSFLLVSTKERDLLMACRSASNPQQAYAAAANAVHELGASTAAASAPAAARGAGMPAASTSAGAAAAPGGSSQDSPAGTAPSTPAAAAAPAPAAAATAAAPGGSSHAAAAGTAASIPATAAAAAPGGSLQGAAAGRAAHTPAAAAAPGGSLQGAAAGTAAHTPAAAAAPGGSLQGTAAGTAANTPAAATAPAAAAPGGSSQGAAAGTAASTPAAAAAPGGSSQGAAAAAGCATSAAPPAAEGATPVHVEGDLAAKIDLLVGMQLHSSELIRAALFSDHFSTGAQGGSSSHAFAQEPAQQQAMPPPQQQPLQQGGCPAAAVATAGTSKGRRVTKQFSVTTKDTKTVPALLQLFQTGWPVDSPLKIYTGLAEPGFAQGLADNEAQLYDVLRQGYLLVKGVKQQLHVTMEQAADIVEVWRDNAAAVLQADGRVVAAGAGTIEGAAVASWLPQQNRKWTVNKLCQHARSMDCVREQKDRAKSAAGREGGAARKKQRTKESGGIV